MFDTVPFPSPFDFSLDKYLTMMTDLCPICRDTVDKSCLQCDKCNDWIHYRCSKLPAYLIIRLSKSSTDNEGEGVEQWADSCDFTLIHDTGVSMTLNCRSHSTVRDGIKATTQTSFSHLIASQTCVRTWTWTLSPTHNAAPSVLAFNQ